MDRKEFLKSACAIGVCGCALNLLGRTALSQAGEPAVPADADPGAVDQRLAFVRYQVAKLVGFLAAAAPPETCAGILEQTGRECARVGQLGARYKGDPEGYFATARQAWGTDFTWDEPGGVVTVAVAEGDCGCPLVDRQRTPAVWCHCSVGYQRESFEAIFGRPVEVTLKESKLSGGARCVFEVKLA